MLDPLRVEFINDGKQVKERGVVGGRVAEVWPFKGNDRFVPSKQGRNREEAAKDYRIRGEQRAQPIYIRFYNNDGEVEFHMAQFNIGSFVKATCLEADYQHASARGDSLCYDWDNENDRAAITAFHARSYGEESEWQDIRQVQLGDRRRQNHRNPMDPVANSRDAHVR
jgi:hypothetical protein